MFSSLHLSFGKRSYILFKTMIKEMESITHLKEKRKFLHQCLSYNILPRSLWFHLPGEFEYDHQLKRFFARKMLRKAIGKLANEIHTIENIYSTRCVCFRQIITDECLLHQLMDFQRVKYETNLAYLKNHFENKLYRLMELFGIPNNSEPNETTDTLNKATPETRKQLVCDLTNSLNRNELKLLSLGPKFSLATAVNEKTLMDFNVEFCRMAHQLRWREILPEKDNSALQKYPWHSRLSMPDDHLRNNDLEDKLRRIYYKTKKIIQNVPYVQKFSNLSSTEKETLNFLKTKPLIYLPSDKGSEFCILSETDYLAAGFQHLSDNSLYSKIAHITPKTIEKRVNYAWNTVCATKEIPSFISRSYITNNSNIPEFYHLIKTHKEGSQLKIRPIVSNVLGPTKKLSWLMSKLLTSLISFVPAHLNNSLELIKAIESAYATTANRYPCSFDIVSMYTSIPPQNAIQNVVHKLNENQISKIKGFQPSDFEVILRTLLDNTYFSFGDQIYKQTSGLPMGSSLSGVLAILYVDTIERRALQSLSVAPLFRRYVDDCFSLVQDKQSAIELLNNLNEIDHNIKFEIEFPSDEHTLSLLDFTVTASQDQPNFEFYKKKVRKDLFVHFRSHMPTSSKIAFIRNERKRITERCSAHHTNQKHQENFTHILKSHEYPQQIIQKCVAKHKRQPRQSTNPIYFKLPYISDDIDRSVKKIFRRERLDVRLTRNTRTLRQELKKKTNATKCNMKQCPVNDNNKCMRKNIVYKITCNRCQKFYIGSTIRNLHSRVKEHMTGQQSSVFKHLQACSNHRSDAITIDILGNDHETCNLRLREALFIQKMRPHLNTKEEMEDHKDFLFL